MTPIEDWLMPVNPISLAAEPVGREKSPLNGLVKSGLPVTGSLSSPDVFVVSPLVL